MYSFNTRVSYSRIDRNGNVPLYEIMNYLQDCSTFQSEELGAGFEHLESEGKAWILAAYKILIKKPLTMGQNICVGTAPTDFKSIIGSRQYCIKDEAGEYMVVADSQWILLDIASRKPIRITENDASVYKTEPKFADITATRKIKFAGEKQQLPDFQVKKTYIDNNGHMNNADYLRAAQEYLPEDFMCSELDIVYSKEALEGQIITPYMYKEENMIGIVFESQEKEILTKIRLIKN